MKSDSRPVIVVPLGYDNDGPCFVNDFKRIGVPEGHLVAVLRVVGEARGQKTISELAQLGGMSESSLTQLFNQLEACGMSFQAHHRSLYGHRIANYPDPARRMAPDEVIVNRLMKLPPDPEGEFLGTAAIDYDNEPILRRHTTRRFNNIPLTFDELSHIALATYGIISTDVTWSGRRTVPSGGAMYPLEIDYIVLNAEIPSGLYRWAKHRNGFIFRRSVESEELTEVFGLLQPEWQHAAVVQVIGFDIGRSSEKYSARAHRFALLEAGHAAQNAMNMAIRLDIGNWQYGGYLDTTLEKLIGMKSSTGGIGTVTFYGHTG